MIGGNAQSLHHHTIGMYARKIPEVVQQTYMFVQALPTWNSEFKEKDI